MAHRNDLRAPRSVDDRFSSRLELFVDVLAHVLDAVEANYSSVAVALDAIRATPRPSSNKDIELLVRYLAPGVTAVPHVFETLPVGWLVPLREHGVFAEPPDVRFHESGSFSFPGWAQGEYLVRIAAEAPAEVFATIKQIPVVDNESVHYAFLKAATRMPAPEAAGVATHEAAWLGSRRWRGGLLGQAVQELVARLISVSEVEAAIELLRAALSLPPSDSTHHNWRTRDARMPSCDYSELVRNALRPLVVLTPDRAKALLFELLDEGHADPVSSWRAAVEDHGQNGSQEEPIDALFDELRDLFDLGCAKGGGAAVRDAVQELEGRERGIYARLALHLLRRHGASAPDLVTARATDQRLLDSAEHFHELTEMIADRYSDLDAPDQARVVRAFRDNSSEAHARQRIGPNADDADVARYSRQCLRQWFAVLGKARSPDLADEYRALCGDAGEPEHPTFNSYLGEVRSGPNPPLRAVELHALPNTELLQYLRERRPKSTDAFDPSRRGLALEVKACAAADPARFSRLASAFKEQRSSYVAAVFWGIHEGLQRAESKTNEAPSTVVDWNSALELAEWASAQVGSASADDDANVEDADDAEQDWPWTRRMLITFVLDAARSPESTVDVVRRSWTIMRRLLVDPDPTSERVDKCRMDDATFAINTVRGQALQASIAIAAISANREDLLDIKEETLDAVMGRADAGREPCPAIRSVLAQEFNTLCALDMKRAAIAAGLLFPTAEEADATRVAAWDTFLHWNEPTTDAFTVLGPPYGAAVRALTATPSEAFEGLARQESAKILRLQHAEGWPVGTIAAELGRHHDTIERVLAQSGHVSWTHTCRLSRRPSRSTQGSARAASGRW